MRCEKNYRSLIASALFLVFTLMMVQFSFADDSAGVAKGHDLYRMYCATCHGLDGRGSGPTAPSLKIAPTDLTGIQQKGEAFPRLSVMLLIDGEKSVPAHGSKDMPVWGKVFRRYRDDMRAKGDIYALMLYLESIQRR